MSFIGVLPASNCCLGVCGPSGTKNSSRIVTPGCAGSGLIGQTQVSGRVGSIGEPARAVTPSVALISAGVSAVQAFGTAVCAAAGVASERTADKATTTATVKTGSLAAGVLVGG